MQKKSDRAAEDAGNRRKGRKKRIILAAVLVAAVAAAAVVVLIVTSSRRRAVPPVSVATVSEVPTSIGERLFGFEQGEAQLAEGAITNTPVSLSEEGLRRFEDYLDSVLPEYEFGDFYDVDGMLQRYAGANIKSVDRHAHDVRVNGKLDADRLYQLVLANNDAYFADGKHAKEFYDIPSKSEIRKLCSRVCEALSSLSQAYAEIDMDMVCCNLYNLKIFSQSTSFANGYINRDNVFSFNEKEIRDHASLMYADDVEAAVLYHEMIHMCQIACPCFCEGDDWRVGVGHNWEQDGGIDPLDWHWLNEASAEMIMSEHLGEPCSLYSTYIGYVKSLDFILQLDDGIGACALERVDFGRDAERLYGMFGANTHEKRTELVHMMYSIDVLQTMPKGFTEEYRKRYGVDLTNWDEQDAFAPLLKDDVLLSMTKLFYRNLARQIARGDTTAEDVYYLIRLWENRLGSHCSYNTYANMAAYGSFFARYTEVQDAFFDCLAESNGTDAGAYADALQAYELRVKDGETERSPNCTLHFLSEAEKQFIEEFSASFYWRGRPSIRECVDLSRECAQKINE